MSAAAIASATDEEMKTPTDLAVARINSALHQLFDDDQVPNAEHVPVGHSVRVCHATEAEWTAYVESESQAYRSRFMLWDAATEEITIVEFPSAAHDCFAVTLGDNIRYGRDVQDSFKAAGASYDSVGSKDEPDLSYGPYRDLVEPHGVVAPRGLWEDFKTLRVEIGVIQPWKQLERKALDVWGIHPGIAYVLCVSITVDLSVGDYKLHDFTGQAPVFPADPVPIVAPATVIHMNSRRLMGLPDDAPLPPHFPDPELEVDLFKALLKARR